MNPGGPGGSGVEFASLLQNDLGLRQFDVVGWDPRGVGASTPIQCDKSAVSAFADADGSPDDRAEVDRLASAAAEFGASCLALSGSLLQHVSTEETVRDLDLLRQLVDEEALNYYGQSYGAAIGSLYATMFPERVGRMVLDGAYSLDDHPVRGTTYAFERQLNALVDFCAKGRSCPLGDHRDEALRQIADLLQSLDHAAMPAGSRQLTQSAAVRAVRFGLYEEFGWARLTHALGAAINHRDGTALLAIDENFTGRDPDGTFPQWISAYFAVTCLDYHDQGVDNRLADAAQEARTSPVLGRHLGVDLSCPLWPVQARGHPRIGADTRPILLVSTIGDPATPYESAVRLSGRLKNSVLLTLEGHGHLAYWQSSCIKEHIVDFLTQGTKPRAGTRCEI